MGRKLKFTNQAKVALSTENATAKLQRASARRAIVDYLLDNGGHATVAELQGHFGFDIRQRISSLERCGWVTIEESTDESD